MSIIKPYNEFAKQYFEYSYEKILQYQLNQFISFLKGKKILDAGTGCGRDAEYLAEMGFDVIGIDAAEKLIDQAKSNIEAPAKFETMDLTKMSFDDVTFDGIWCLAVLHLFEKDEAKRIIQTFHKLLKPEGVIYLGLVEGEGGEVVKDKALNLTELPMYCYTHVEIEELLFNLGFDIINTYSEADEDNRSWLNVFARKK